MAARGAHVVIAGRDQAKLDDAAAEITADGGNGTVETLVVDLASLNSVRAAGAEANDRFDKIDILINNAGIMACPQGQTADGFESQFGTNHLGHFVLTKYLMPLIEQGTNKRIVNLSSRGHHMGPVNFDDPNFASREYDKWASYGQAKTANVLFSVGHENRFADKGIHAYAVHPGGIMTNLSRHLSQEDLDNLRERVERSASDHGGNGFKTVPQGAATQSWAATAPELEGRGGVYCEDCHVAEVNDDAPIDSVRSYAVDRGNADRLWELSERLTGESFSA